MIKHLKYTVLSLGLLATVPMAQASDSLSGKIFPINQLFCLSQNASLYAGSNSFSRKLAQLSAGEQYRATGKTGDRRWIRLNAKGKTGFVRRRSVASC